MHNHDNSEQRENGEKKQETDSYSWPDWLPKWLFRLIGPIALIVVVIASVAAYIAHYYVTKDSPRLEFWVGFMFGFLTLVVITVQLVIYAQQADFMKQQARASSQLIELMVANERAYIRIRLWEKPIFENGAMKLNGIMLNAGKTPAWQIASNTRISLEPMPQLPPAPNDFWEPPSSGGALGAGEDRPFQVKPFDVTDDQIKDLESGSMFYVKGVCSYVDNLGGQQFYTYGFQISCTRGASALYERHHRIAANQNNPD